MRVPPIILPAKTAHTATVIFLHGLGDSGAGWEPVAQMLAPQLPQVKWILPNAPHQRVTLNFGMEMPAWYDIKSLDNRTSGEDEDGMWKTVDSVTALIQTEIAAGIPSERIILGGFSQGAAMSLLTGISMQDRLGGLAILSGYLPLSSKIHEHKKDGNAQTHIFMAHGLDDDVVQYQWGKSSAQKLIDLGYAVDFKSYPNMGHSGSPEEFRDLLFYLKQRLG